MSIPMDNDQATWRPKAIIFDLLTALLDSWSLWDACTPSVTAAEGQRWREQYHKLTFGAGAYVPYDDLVRRSTHDVGLPPSAPEALLRDWEKLEAWPETTRVLRSLGEKGYKLGVVTNCSKSLGHMAVRRLEDCASEGATDDAAFGFDVVVTAEESGFYKPVKAAYQAILDAMGLEPGDALFVAGSAGDVQGATDVGMRVVWHNRIVLARVGQAAPLKEARMLDETLGDFL